MTYVVVFDISERIPEALVAVPATASCLAIVGMSTWRRGRAALRRSAWFWLALAAIGWPFVIGGNLGGPTGPLVGAWALLPACVGVLAYFDRPIPLNTEQRIGSRQFGSVLALVVLGLVALCSCYQWPAFDLQRELAAGRAEVVAGTVHDAHNYNLGYEWFVVEGHTFSYVDSPTSVGFHQVAKNGGPIHDGVQVRVWYIGDVIVRLEVAT